VTGSRPEREPARERNWFDRQPFLETHRAHAMCAREVTRLLDEVGGCVALLHSTGATPAAVVRQSPDRFMAQLGPVALTVAWLRSPSESVANGELLVIVWRGTVAPSRSPQPEITQSRPVTTAVALWEEILRVSAESDTAWLWQTARGRGFTAAQLAERCVDRLRVAYNDCCSTL
jgi:hypothetical protein